MSGFGRVADDPTQLRKTHILIGRSDRPTLKAVAEVCIKPTCAPFTQLDASQIVPELQRDARAEGQVAWSDSGTGSTADEEVPAISDVSVSHPETAAAGDTVVVTVSVTGEVAASGQPYRWVRAINGNEWLTSSSSCIFRDWPTSPGTRTWEVFVTGIDGVEYGSGQFSITWED